MSISSHFSTRCFQVRCKLANYVSKFGNWFGRTFQCLNYCKQMFIVQVEINNSMESSWSSGLPRRFVFHWIGYYYWVSTFVYKRNSNIEMNLRTFLRSSRPISELANIIGKFATNLGTAHWKMTWNRQYIIRLVIKAYYNSYRVCKKGNPTLTGYRVFIITFIAFLFSYL